MFAHLTSATFTEPVYICLRFIPFDMLHHFTFTVGLSSTCLCPYIHRNLEETILDGKMSCTVFFQRVEGIL